MGGNAYASMQHRSADKLLYIQSPIRRSPARMDRWTVADLPLHSFLPITKLLKSTLFVKLPAIRFHILTSFLVGKLVVLPPFRGAIRRV